MSAVTAWAEAAVPGLVRGLTDSLPVSSSARLRFVGPLLPSGVDPGAAFTPIIHCRGTACYRSSPDPSPWKSPYSPPSSC